MGESHHFILIKQKSVQEVTDLLEQCAEKWNMRLIEGRPEERLEPIMVVGVGDGCSYIYLPNWHKACAKLREVVSVPWIEIRAQDGDHWDYTLYQGSKVIDEFSTKPNYWDGDGPDDLKYDHKKGKSNLLAEIWNIPVERIEKYLVNWEMYPDEEEIRIPRVKAYPTDQNPYGSVFQVNDFANTLGVRYDKATSRVFYTDPSALWRP